MYVLDLPKTYCTAPEQAGFWGLRVCGVRVAMHCRRQWLAVGGMWWNGWLPRYRGSFWEVRRGPGVGSITAGDGVIVFAMGFDVE